MKRLFTVLVIIIILGLGALAWWKSGAAAADPSDKSQKIFVVQKGEGIREIASRLKNEGLIKDSVVFFLLVKKLGYDGKIQAGDFRLSPSQSAAKIAENLTHGSLDIWITIPEGKRAEEIADILEKNVPTYQQTWRSTLNEQEGYLFPDTYLIPRDANINLIVKLMKNNFQNKYAQIQKNPKNILTDQQIVIVASMVEREARFSQDRPLVASVIINRFNIGMPLQIDATIQYALGYNSGEKTWWKKNLTIDDLKLKSLYNTYENAGLPPTPISNPGFDVLQAAAKPADTDYLYYISDKSGHNHYAKTGAEHNANIKKYGL